ncbi:FAD/NAD(P)-binding domain-containing protein [Mycena olivaceomarginata]|nr:FAD/NAD(P)-binding domain-containing protein [Mycena olivaceomarginata]
MLARQLLLCYILVSHVRASWTSQHAFSAASAFEPTKRIGVIGLGTGGIATLRALRALPLHMREGWEITAFDERHAVGGLWVPQDHPPDPPSVPQTPAYPGLRMNAVHMHMTVPGEPFPPETPLLAPRERVLEYWQGLFDATPLGEHDPPAWVGDAERGYWDVQVMDLSTNRTTGFQFDNLIVAPGVNRFPRVPTFEGQDAWLAAGKRLEHCMWFRDSNRYAGQTVLAVGGGPSGLDVARHVVHTARKLYWSRQDGEPELPDIRGAENVPRMVSLKNGLPTLNNGATLPDVDTIILATGYEVRVPFLSATGFLDETPPLNGDRLTTNWPLHLTALRTHRRARLAATFAAYTIANASLLGARDELRAALAQREQHVRNEAGVEPERYGHKVNSGYGAEEGYAADGFYQDLLVRSLVARDPRLAGMPGIPRGGFNLTERWRVWVVEHTDRVLVGWHEMVDERGEGWEEGVPDYMDTMRRFLEFWDDY